MRGGATSLVTAPPTNTQRRREVEARVTTEGRREGRSKGGTVEGTDGLGWGLQGVLRGLVVWG